MRKRSRVIVMGGLLVMGVAGLIWGVVWLVTPSEPSYQGKTLSEWIAPFCRQTAKGLDAPGGPQHFEELEPVRRAVREMGSNAIPFLIAKLNHRESGLHREVRQFLDKQPYTALRLDVPNLSKVRAIRALAILRTNARPAIPSLTAQLADTALSDHAVYALSGMGEEGMRALIGQYTNVPAFFRMEIATAVVAPAHIYRGPGNGSVSLGGNYESVVMEAYQMQTNEISPDVLIEGFCQIAKDNISPFRTAAIQRLGLYGPLASKAIPVLLPMVNDQNPFVFRAAILGLGDIRSQPDIVVPALSDLMNSADSGKRMAAAIALRAFGYNVQPDPSGFTPLPGPYQLKPTNERYF